MKRTMEGRAQWVVYLDCDACTEKSLLLIPRQRAPYGIVNCPRCGVAYLVSLDSREEAGRPAPPQVTAPAE